MFEKYTLDAQKILTLAESIAFSYSSAEVNDLHLFIAFLKSNETELASFLRSNGAKVMPFEALLKPSKKAESLDNPFYLEYTKDLLNIMTKSEKISKDKKEKKISSLSLSLALMSFESENLDSIYHILKVDKDIVVKTLEKAYRKSSELDSIIDLHRLGIRKLDPLIGRKEEIEELIKALRKRNKANAVLIGEPGVGKTHIVEHLAKKIEDGEIPELEDKKIYELDIASAVSGTKYRGEFEEKIKKIIKKVIEDGHTILFIDEIHNIVKAGGAEGAIDCANIIKPYLTRGEISIIGATTFDEYEKVFSEDKALKRRFQPIRIRPNTHAETAEILKSLLPLYQSFYNITIPENSIEQILTLTDRYASNEFYPDKAIDVLDNACLNSKNEVTEQIIIETIEKLYKVKVDFKPKAESVIDKISKEIKGQDNALYELKKNLKVIDNTLYDTNKPLGVYLFVGPSGVGKTQTAKLLAKYYFNSELSFFKIDMADYRDSSSLSRLNGTSPGYVGYKEVSPLVRQLKSFPHSLILLDEIEKASTSILDFFLNIFDEGYFIDGMGQKISTSNVIFVLTSNYSFDSDHLFSSKINSSKSNMNQIRKVLEEKFRYEFLARLDDIILFDYLNEDAKKGILTECLRNYKNIDDSLALEISNDILLTSNKAEINRYGARALKKIAKNKILNLQTNKNFSSIS